MTDRITIHRLKTWPPYFQEIVTGNKTFDIRVNDRDFNWGDIIQFEEYDPDKKEYTGRFIRKRIGFMIQGLWGIPNDRCVMSLLPEEE